MKQVILTVAALLLSATIATADTPDRRAVSAPLAEELLSSSPVTLTLPTLPLASAAPLPSYAITETRLFRLPEMAPESLQLSFAIFDSLDFVLAADLDSDLPRLDSVDDETYFSVGFHSDVTPWLTVFVEDFMSASTVVGSDRDFEADPVPGFSWDGHQASVGGILTVNERVSVRAEAIAYVLSETKRSPGLGARAAVTVRF